MTTKDFISYNNPCFSCKSKINFELCILNKDTTVVSKIQPVPHKNSVKFPLIIGYSNSLDLIIDPLSNTFKSNNMKQLISYYKGKDFYFRVSCPRCKSEITSGMLDFSFEKGFIKPVVLFIEHLFVKTKGNTYEIVTTFDDDTSHLSVYNKDGSYLNMNFKSFPLFKFKNKEKFMNKVKTYLIFS